MYVNLVTTYLFIFSAVWLILKLPHVSPDLDPLPIYIEAKFKTVAKISHCNVLSKKNVKKIAMNFFFEHSAEAFLADSEILLPILISYYYFFRYLKEIFTNFPFKISLKH